MAITSTQSLDPIKQTIRWFEVAVPSPSEQNTHTQHGIHFEEVFEMTQALGGAGETVESCRQLTFAGDVLSYFQRQFKSGDLGISFDKINRVELRGALCNQIVAAVAHMLKMDIEGALKEVVNSIDSKFDEDDRIHRDGTPDSAFPGGRPGWLGGLGLRPARCFLRGR